MSGLLTSSKPLVYFKYASSVMILWYMILKVKVLLDKGESRTVLYVSVFMHV